MTAHPDDTYRGHRIEVLNAGPRGWVAYVDMHEIGIGVTEQIARAIAKHWIDEAIWEQFTRRPLRREATRPAPLRAVPVLRVIEGGVTADEDAVRRALYRDFNGG